VRRVRARAGLPWDSGPFYGLKVISAVYMHPAAWESHIIAFRCAVFVGNV
jgi:hypothetical protein